MATEAFIELLGAAGNLQITATQGVGYGLAHTGSLTLVDDNASHPQPMVIGAVTVTGVNPVFAYKANGNICVERTIVSGSSFTFRLRAQSNNPIGLQWWVFDTAATSVKDPTMAGLVGEVRDEYGVVTFDATMAAMRIAQAVETAKTPSVVPFGGVASIADTTTITVPAGKVYAIVQSTPCFVFTTYDNGGYSSSQQRPQDLGIGLENEPGPGTRWRTQTLESFQSTGGYSNANTIRVGLSRFEYFNLGWQSVDSTPFIDVHGQARHLIVDVTNFTSAGGVSPTIVTVGVNASTRSVSTGGASVISQSTTPAVTASVAGGTAPYAYLWQFVSGNEEVSGGGPYNGASFFTTTGNQPAGSTRSAIYRCRVTDANGFVGYSGDVSFTHVAQAYSVDVSPNTLTLAPFDINTNDANGWNGSTTQIAGINQTITLRVERYDYSGNLSECYVNVYRGPTANGPWTALGSFNVLSSGYQYFDSTWNNGDFLHYAVDARTNSGVRSANFDIAVHNLTAGGQLSRHRTNIVVDANNDYANADYTPNALNWSNASQTSNDPTVWADTNVLTISGINREIAIRGTISSTTGTSTQGELEIWKNGSWAGGSTNDGNGSWCQANFVNGDQVMFRGYIVSPSGRRTRNYNVTATNQSANGATLDTFSMALVADNNNDHNVVDQSANPISLNDQTVSTNADTAYTAGTYFQITGINQAITLSFTRDSLTQTGNAFTRRTIIGHSTNGGASYSEFNLGAAAGASVNRTANNGDWFFIKGYLDTTAGTASAQWRNHVTNATTGEYLGSAWVNITVDADNNFNIAPPPSVSLTTTYLAPDHFFTNQGVNATVYTDTTTAVVSGGQAPFTYQWERVTGLSTWVIANPNSLTTSFRYAARTNYIAEANFRLKVTDALGRIAYSPEVYCYVSAGNILS